MKPIMPVSINSTTPIQVDQEISSYMSTYNVTFDSAVKMYELAQNNLRNTLLKDISDKLSR